MLKELFFSFQESISTCRFAQRVALIKNEAVLNEEIDPRLVRGFLGGGIVFLFCLVLVKRYSHMYVEDFMMPLSHV